MRGLTLRLQAAVLTLHPCFRKPVILFHNHAEISVAHIFQKGPDGISSGKLRWRYFHNVKNAAMFASESRGFCAFKCLSL